MKISKSLLKAMMIGVSLGAVSSCTELVDEVKKEDLQHECTVDCENGCTEKSNTLGDNCPACGMG